MHIGPCSSAITISLELSLRSMPSRVRMISSWAALRTMTLPPRMRDASKVCSGCPSSKSTKLEMSTMLLIGLSPMLWSLSRSHCGDWATFTPRMVSPLYLGAPLGSSTRMSRPLPSPSRNASTLGRTSSQGMPLWRRYAYRSRATPQWEAASTLLAVISYSMTALVSSLRYSFAGVPTTASSGSTIMPSWLLPIPSSSSAQIIPKDSTPLIFDFLILKSPGSTVPIWAKSTFWPAATFGAPQTTVRGSPSPVDTFVMWRWSESGWFSHSST